MTEAWYSIINQQVAQTAAIIEFKTYIIIWLLLKSLNAPKYRKSPSKSTISRIRKMILFNTYQVKIKLLLLMDIKHKIFEIG
jgi:hypothetical protein